MVNTFEQLPPEHAATLSKVLEKRSPELAQALLNTDAPSTEQREQVEDAVADELMGQLVGPSWEPTPYGWDLENLIDAFLRRFPIEPTSRRGCGD